MKSLKCFVLTSLLVVVTAPSVSQSISSTSSDQHRNPRAVDALEKAATVLADKFPSDSTINAIVELAEGETANFFVQTRGVDQSFERFTSSHERRNTGFNVRVATLDTDGARQEFSLERSASARSCIFLLPFLLKALGDPDFDLEYIGDDVISDLPAKHIRIRNSFRSNPRFSRISGFTTKDVLLDATTGLPLRVSFEERDGEGREVPSIAVRLDFSEYKRVNGNLIPFTVTRYHNGTFWGTIKIQQVQFNTGITDLGMSAEEVQQ